MKPVYILFLSTILTLTANASFADPVKDPKLSPNPVYQTNTPLFTAQNASPSSTVYDSYWILGQWKIHCSQTEFCYLHLPPATTKDYEGGQVVDPITWEKDKQVDHSIAFGIKGGTIRTHASLPFFSWQGRTFTDDFEDYNKNGRPHITATYIIDGKEVATRDHGKTAPLKVSMWGDWEADTRPLISQILSHLYHTDPKEMEIRISVDQQPAMGLVFDVRGFKTVYDNVMVEKKARKAHLSKEGKFASWPSVAP